MPKDYLWRRGLRTSVLAAFVVVLIPDQDSALIIYILADFSEVEGQSLVLRWGYGKEDLLASQFFHHIIDIVGSHDNPVGARQVERLGEWNRKWCYFLGDR